MGQNWYFNIVDKMDLKYETPARAAAVISDIFISVIYYIFISDILLLYYTAMYTLLPKTFVTKRLKNFYHFFLLLCNKITERYCSQH